MINGSRDGWDLMIAFPPCTHLCVSGARWFKDKANEQAGALAFVRMLLGAPIKHIALENPIGVISTKIRKPDQIIQPWQFGHVANCGALGPSARESLRDSMDAVARGCVTGGTTSRRWTYMKRDLSIQFNENHAQPLINPNP